MGYSFAAGTIDGPGAFDFTQGTSIVCVSPSYVKLQCTCTFAGSLAALTVHVFNNPHSCLELLSEKCVCVAANPKTLSENWKAFFHKADSFFWT